MAAITLTNLSKSFGPVEVLKDINLTIADQEFCVLVGPSGCGKSTLLRLIAGLEEVKDGTIEIGGTSSTISGPATATSRWCSRAMRSIRTRRSGRT